MRFTGVFLDRVSACENSASSADRSGHTGLHWRTQASDRRRSSCKLNHVLAIIFQACTGFRHHWLGSVHSIKVNALLKRIDHHFSHRCILFDECSEQCIGRVRGRPQLAMRVKNQIIRCFRASHARKACVFIRSQFCPPSVFSSFSIFAVGG